MRRIARPLGIFGLSLAFQPTPTNRLALQHFSRKGITRKEIVKLCRAWLGTTLLQPPIKRRVIVGGERDRGQPPNIPKTRLPAYRSEDTPTNALRPQPSSLKPEFANKCAQTRPPTPTIFVKFNSDLFSGTCVGVAAAGPSEPYYSSSDRARWTARLQIPTLVGMPSKR